MSRDLLRRVRWANLARAGAAVALLAVVIAWPRLAADPPALPGDAATPLATPVPAPSPARPRAQRAGTPPERHHAARRPNLQAPARPRHPHRRRPEHTRFRPGVPALAVPVPLRARRGREQARPDRAPVTRPAPPPRQPTPAPPRSDAALREFGFEAG